MPGVHPEVEVLLATYHGERFLAAQVESLFAQTYSAVRIVARDDGSSDGTAARLQGYAAAYPDRFRVSAGSGTPLGGAKQNFERLMQHATAEYIAFSDQDDVWLPEKLERCMVAIAELEATHGRSTPLLVFTDAQLVDQALHPLHASLWRQQGIQPERVHTLRHLLPQNVVTGCTMLCNRVLLELAREMPAGAFMHDRWMALVACIFGHAAPVHERSMLYRQHGGNTVGAGRRRRFALPRLWDSTRRSQQWKTTEQQADALLQHFGAALPPDARDVLERFVAIRRHRSGFGRAAAMLHGNFFTTGLRSNLDMLWYLLTPESQGVAR